MVHILKSKWSDAVWPLVAAGMVPTLAHGHRANIVISLHLHLGEKPAQCLSGIQEVALKAAVNSHRGSHTDALFGQGPRISANPSESSVVSSESSVVSAK